MTRRSPLPLFLWVLDVILVGVITVGAFGGVFMPALLLDLVSFWPGYVLAAMAALLLRWGASHRRALAHAAPPVVVGVLIVTALGLYLARWPQLPSSAGDLAGPPAGQAGVADLSLEVSGHLTVSAGSQPLYLVQVDRRGGRSGVPEALEAMSENREVVRIREAEDSWWFRSAGWHLRLSVEPDWTLQLGAGSLSADLRGIRLRRAKIDGTGEVALPTPDGAAAVEVSGDLTLNVPSGVPIQVVGSAAVPDGWRPTPEGWLSPVDGEGLIITILTGSVAIEER